jgi:hypothetical protein
MAAAGFRVTLNQGVGAAVNDKKLVDAAIDEMTNGQLLNHFEKIYQANHCSPQELKSMNNPSAACRVIMGGLVILNLDYIRDEKKGKVV